MHPAYNEEVREFLDAQGDCSGLRGFGWFVDLGRSMDDHWWLDYQQFHVRCYTCKSSGLCEHVVVEAEVAVPEQVPLMQGMLLVLLQDRLPHLLQQDPRQLWWGSPTVSVDMRDSDGGSLSMWAPLVPVLRELQVTHGSPVTRLLVHDPDNRAEEMRIVFSSAG